VENDKKEAQIAYENTCVIQELLLVFTD